MAKVTVCQMSDEHERFAADWEDLAAHVQMHASDLVVLNEMPFSPWFCAAPTFDNDVWQAVVAEHDRWLARLEELAPATVIGSRPVTRDGRRINEGFVWNPATGYRAAHEKYYLPDEESTWEATWYQRGNGRFDRVSTACGPAGFLICSELWAMGHAQAYGKAGVRLLVIPRATGTATVEKWLVGGRAAAIVAGAFSLSSNRVSESAFGGCGWVVSPDGEVLATTSPNEPFITVNIDIEEADRAKTTYPRYVLD